LPQILLVGECDPNTYRVGNGRQTHSQMVFAFVFGIAIPQPQRLPQRGADEREEAEVGDIEEAFDKERTLHKI